LKFAIPWHISVVLKEGLRSGMKYMKQEERRQDCKFSLKELRIGSIIAIFLLIVIPNIFTWGWVH
jgi:hypothetical protein